MKYFHRTQLPPEAVLARAATFFGARLTPVEEQPRRRRFLGRKRRRLQQTFEKSEHGHGRAIVAVGWAIVFNALGGRIPALAREAYFPTSIDSTRSG